ncbi:DNA repair protein RadA [Candidatus Daviesbacteria bacterium]|nr:DNA repair protein RadA [Candidatus Daviesbacteria bacterium]
MPKFTSSYICQQCGYRSVSYLGKCPQCDSWNSFVEEVEKTQKSKVKSQKYGSSERAEIIDLSKIKQVNYQRLTTKTLEFDRVLGGGIVLGSINLVSGEPGIGKSTLLTQLALNIENTLYVAGEESAQQIKIRVDRIKPNASLSVLNEVDVDAVVEAIKSTKPALVIIDSIQTLETSDLESIAGSVGQVRESAARLQRVAKDLHIPLFLVGHVTKEGTMAGPKTLEHLVDVVLSLEGETTNLFRILRATKNRFGPTDEVGVFEMEEGGMVEVKNPSKLFLDTKVNAPGSTVACILTGLRPLMVEIQALVTKTSLPSPRRVGSGVDNNRLQLLVAVLQKRMGLPLYDLDIFVNVTGGLKIFEPAADLAICLAIISSFKDLIIIEKTVFIGEVGLLGELRQVRALDKREAEAKKLGFSNIISGKTAKSLTQVNALVFKNK